MGTTPPSYLLLRFTFPTGRMLSPASQCLHLWSFVSRSAVVPPGSSTLVVGVEILCVPLCSHVIVDALIDLCGALMIESCKRVAGRYKIWRCRMKPAAQKFLSFQSLGPCGYCDGNPPPLDMHGGECVVERSLHRIGRLYLLRVGQPRSNLMMKLVPTFAGVAARMVVPESRSRKTAQNIYHTTG
jgi:hypothetical protein